MQRSIPRKKKVNSLIEDKKEDANKKQLNLRIFKLSSRVKSFLYYFNLVFNSIFRVSLILIIILEFLEKKENTIPTVIIFGLEGACLILYAIAMTKLLYTKSSEISVYFQKTFYEQPYA